MTDFRVCVQTWATANLKEHIVKNGFGYFKSPHQNIYLFIESLPENQSNIYILQNIRYLY